MAIGLDMQPDYRLNHTDVIRPCAPVPPGERGFDGRCRTIRAAPATRLPDLYPARTTRLG